MRGLGTSGASRPRIMAGARADNVHLVTRSALRAGPGPGPGTAWTVLTPGPAALLSNAAAAVVSGRHNPLSPRLQGQASPENADARADNPLSNQANRERQAGV